MLLCHKPLKKKRRKISFSLLLEGSTSSLRETHLLFSIRQFISFSSLPFILVQFQLQFFHRDGRNYGRIRTQSEILDKVNFFFFLQPILAFGVRFSRKEIWFGILGLINSQEWSLYLYSRVLGRIWVLIEILISSIQKAQIWVLDAVGFW